MEAIKFSELPTGDRMPLADEDGVPIIANQENRLLTWGRLKKQLAAQTHTDEVKPDDTKVPTSAAVENRIAAAEDDLQTKLEPLETKLDEHDTAVNNAVATAQEAKTMAESASSVASSAQNAAEAATSTANAAQNMAENAASVANSAQNAISEATSSISAVSDRVASIETKIENGEIGGAEEVDLTPITERLGAVESKDTAQDGRLDVLEAKDTTHESAISEAKTAADAAQSAAEAAQATADVAKVAAVVESLSVHKLICAEEISENTGESTGKFSFDSTTEDLDNTTLASLAAHFDANFQNLATYIENHPDGLDEVISISKGVMLNDSLLDENGNYIGATSLYEDTHYLTMENCPITLQLAVNRLYHNQAIMFEIMKYQLKELAARKNDVDTVVKNINSVFAQVMN